MRFCLNTCTVIFNPSDFSNCSDQVFYDLHGVRLEDRVYFILLLHELNPTTEQIVIPHYNGSVSQEVKAQNESNS